MDTGTHKNPPQKTRAKWWAVGSVLALLAAIAAVFLHSPPAIPHVAGALSAHNTVAFAAVEAPDRWLHEVDRAAAVLTPDERAVLAPVLSAENRKRVLGFEPATAEGWQAAGVDAERGMAVTLDARSGKGTAPTSFLWVADGPPHAAALASLAWQSQGKWSVAAWPASPLATAPTATDDGPRLDADPVLRAAFADLPTGPRTALYAHGDGLLTALRPHLDAKKLALAEHIAPRVRGAALVITPTELAGRIVLAADGVESLRQIFGNHAPKTPFSPFLPREGVLALRVSLNLEEIFDGLMTWLPPQWLEARLGLASSRIGLLALVGLDWTQLERAFSGQAVLALDLSSAPTPETPLPWLVLLSVRDPAVADAALQHLVDRSRTQGKLVVPLQVAGHAGWLAQEPPVALVRVENTVIAAPNAQALERAVRRSDALATTPDVDGDVVAGLTFQPPGKALGWPGIAATLEPTSLALHREMHGLRLTASRFPLTSLLHAGAWLLRPRAP